MTSAVDVYSLGKLIFFLFSGGVRVPRERISENPYASWLAAPGAVGLRLLLTQMICPLRMRIATIDVVLQRLRHLRTPPAARGLSEAGLLFHNTAQSNLADSQRLAQERADARNQAQGVLKAAIAQLSEIVDDQIRAGADALHVEGAIKAWVQRLDAISSIKVGPRTIQVSGVHELLYQPGASPTARIWALRFFVHERTGSGSKVGLMAELQMRESTGQPVLRCSAWLKQTGGRNQTFEITNAGPAVLEVAPELVAEAEGQIRDFIRDAVSSVPALADIGYSQFMVASMAGRGPRS